MFDQDLACFPVEFGFRDTHKMAFINFIAVYSSTFCEN